MTKTDSSELVLTRWRRAVISAAVMFAACITPALGATQTNEELAAELATLKTEVAQLRAAQNESWLTQRRAQEVKTLIHEVLADSETRASLLDSDLTAGWNKHFFLASADGKFLLQIQGQIQVRWLMSNVNTPAKGDDEHHSGFQLRRIKLKFGGHIGDPRFQYKITLAADRDNDDQAGDTYPEEAWVSYTFDNGISVKAGRQKAHFLREEFTSSTEQLAVERSYVNEQFTTGWTEGITAAYAAEKWKVALSINDGAEKGEYSRGGNDFNDVDSDFAITTRADVRLAGDWKQAKDFTSWSGEDLAVFLGGGLHWELDEDTGAATDDQNNFFMWTVDTSAEMNGLGFYTAVVGYHERNDQADHASDGNAYGWVIQGSYNIADKIEPFVRYDKLCGDPDARRSELRESQDFITAGFNYYIHRHAAKFTADVVYALQSVEHGESGLGLVTAGQHDDLWVLRLQFQLLF